MAVRGSFGSVGEDPKLAGGVSLFWQRLDTEQRGWSSSPTFGNALVSSFGQEPTEDQFGLGGLVKLSVPVSQSVSVFSKAGAARVYRRAELDGWQRNRCDLCGPDEGLFNVDVDDSGFTWVGTMAAGLKIRLAPELSVGAVGHCLSYADTSQIVNPVQGDAALYEPTRLDDERATGWQFGAGIHYHF